ncbi:hypothetical protein LCGC14_1092950 [marine sediment metagenome]|uniref:Uncharacterized protein n=1 Tax=marine sediment metagenome TaxID=412755 RepID=A0A0F9MZK7_9ZZZZ
MAKKKTSRTKVKVSNSERVGFAISDEVYKRARRTIGMRNEQIAAYGSEVSLVAAMNRMHPKSNPEARVKAVEVPEQPRVEDNMPDKIEFESKMEARSMANRTHFDEQNLQAELRKINRQYDTHDPVRIVTDKSFKPINGKDKKGRSEKQLITKYTVYYK